MIVYILLLLIAAAVAYFFGSMSTVVIASNFVFHRNLYRLGRGNALISNFRRVYGWKGAVKLLLVELVRDIVPILIGGVLLGFKGHAEVGRVFAGFCLVVGRLYSVFYDMKGSSATLCLVVMGMFVDTSAGIAAGVMAAAVTLLSKYVSLGTVAGAVTLAITTALVVDDSIIVKLTIYTALMVALKHIPAIFRILNGKEERLSFKEDLTYKLDQPF